LVKKEVFDMIFLINNFIKSHESLAGKTPSEMAGITIEGNNKWLILMHKAIQYYKTQNIK